MSRQLTYSLIADGGTDRSLVPIVEWAIHRLDPEVQILEPEFRKRRGTVKDFLRSYKSGAMIVFVHRDAENATLATRLLEFQGVERGDVVPVIPIRMTEAWLLIDRSAIAKASNHPSAVVTLPPVNQLELRPDPKNDLEECLLLAAGNLTGRRRKRFRESIVDKRVNVASFIEDFSPLEQLSSFQRFQSDLANNYPYGIQDS